MGIMVALMIAVMTGCGVYLILRLRTFPVVLGLTMLSYAVNIFLFAMGRLRAQAPAVIGETSNYTDPLPQALVLTAIVIGFAMTAFLMALALRAWGEFGTDHVDGKTVEQDAADEERR